MGNRDSAILYAKRKESLCQKHDVVQPDLYQEYGVKRGLRDEEGRGVLTGLTNISEITAFREENGKKIPSLSVIYKTAQFFNLSLSDFAALIEEKL